VGYVVAADAIDPARDDTTTTRVTIDRSCGCERLEQRVVEYAPGRARPQRLESRQEVLYVQRGRGTITINGRTHELEPDAGVYVAAGDEYAIENIGAEPLTIVAVSAPEERGAQPDDARRVVRYAEQPRCRRAQTASSGTS
jgi:mannose-6-phosphate isomerase-like protein (cupin superfamily)